MLRAGAPTVACPHLRRAKEGWDYVVCRHLGKGENQYQLWPFGLQERLPRIAIPLSDGTPEVVLDLQAVFNRVYESGRYELRVDYEKECSPRPSVEDAKWIDELLRKKKLRK